MANKKHLTLKDRINIQSGLDKGLKFYEIAILLGKDKCTVSKEVRKHLTIKKSGAGGQKYNPCANAGKCMKFNACPTDKPFCGRCCVCGKCIDYCKDFVYYECPRLLLPPYCCNACQDKRGCHLTKKYYIAADAQDEYYKLLSESRKGFLISEEEAARLSGIVQPLVNQGHSIHHICATHRDEIMLNEKTIYAYIDNGVLDVKNIDLPRKVRYRLRKKPQQFKVDRACRINRTYDDYLEFLIQNDYPSVVQMDSVKGSRTGAVLLTIYFVSTGFMLAYLREANTAKSVTNIFNDIYHALGRETFMRLFPVILTDNGCEFSDPTKIEFDENGERRTYVFYCNQNRSDQKGNIEVNHEFIRRVSPKGVPFDSLSQEDINLMMSHINSYKRKRLNDQSPYSVFSLFYGNDIPLKLGISEIPATEINLTPKLFKK